MIRRDCRRDVLFTPRGRVALWRLKRYQPELILVQEELRDMSALDLLLRLRSRSSTAHLPVTALYKSVHLKQDFWLAGATAVAPSLGFDTFRMRPASRIRAFAARVELSEQVESWASVL